MPSSAVDILNVLYIILSAVGILLILFFLFNMYWKRVVIQRITINLYDLKTKQPNVAYLMSKRVLDLIGSLISLWLFLPLMLTISALIKLIYRKQSIFVKKMRVGADGKPFYELHFRTTDEYSGQSRLFGKYIRKLNLDYLPLLLNVCKGEFSFVGRSKGIEMILEHHRQLEAPFDRLLHIQPGITSLWAVSLDIFVGDANDLSERLKYDLSYYENMSLLFDLALLIRTGIIILGRSSGAQLTEE